MNDELTTAILNKLNTIEARQTKQDEVLRTISERIARLEARLDMHDEKLKENEESVDDLEESKNKGMGAKNVVLWGISVALSLLAIFHEFFK